LKGRAFLEAKLKKMRERLTKHRQKLVEMEAQAVEMEQDIKRAEEGQLGYLARSAANSLTGGMEEVFELLRSLRAKPENNTGGNTKPEPPQKSDETVEGASVYGNGETESADEADA